MLTDEQISALNERVDAFQAANGKAQDYIIGGLLRDFKRACPPGDEFDPRVVENVRTPSVALSHSQTFLAYSPAHFPPNQAGTNRIRFRNQSASWRKVCTLFTN